MRIQFAPLLVVFFLVAALWLVASKGDERVRKENENAIKRVARVAVGSYLALVAGAVLIGIVGLGLVMLILSAAWSD